MSAPSQVLWALDQHISPRDFERLCVDLLSREGYWSIVPVGGTRDQGRDAEAVYWRGKSQPAAEVVFQFSLERDWERKLRADVEKITRHGAAPQAMVFVTSQTVSGEKQDKLRTELKASRGWALTIRSREWLRLRLEEFHPDLAKRYLGLELPATVSSIAAQLDRFVLEGPSGCELFRELSAEQVRTAVIESTRREPLLADHWQRLAKIECHLENFQAALEAVNHAVALEPANFNVQQLHAAILAELGIERRSKPYLLLHAFRLVSGTYPAVDEARTRLRPSQILKPLNISYRVFDSDYAVRIHAGSLYRHDIPGFQRSSVLRNASACFTSCLSKLRHIKSQSLKIDGSAIQ